MSSQQRIVVVGGGFYGTSLAAHLAREGASVVLLEARADLHGGASYFNQARVHGGYHYPRSLRTAGRSQASYVAFMERYRSCVVDDFLCIYAIARGSLTNARKFQRMCNYIGAPLQDSPASISRLFNRSVIEGSWVTRESVFDAVRLRDLMRQELDEAGVQVRLGTPVAGVGETATGTSVALESGEVLDADRVLVCTYGEGIDDLPAGVGYSGLHCEPCEMALVDLPDSLKDKGITVMDGPYFSLMPFPSTPYHTLSHVRYTPHGSYATYGQAAAALRAGLTTRADWMIRDSARYVPALAEAVHRESIWGVKTVPARRDRDDARPIVLRRSEGGRVLSLLGSKIDNINDALRVAEEHLRDAV
ncbi:FAD-dependent oxidoreductase [Blastococcus sp. BMG 814]|uniref:FAD-dependent oxidoreductase n=1 Tax=Blastococcus carthaginiensis TaxID=3050034 RepID=A0ABT9IB83_9ACTN|nr:FAD-dependent oxidoreductase [Blastococcus carthaginiensis]MDP5182816.1 FAD-dependent oxidoreductase [Blastococcus carthaginiensis]